MANKTCLAGISLQNWVVETPLCNKSRTGSAPDPTEPDKALASGLMWSAHGTQRLLPRSLLGAGHRLVLFLYKQKNYRRVTSVGELVPRNWRGVRVISSAKLHLSCALLVLNPRLAATQHVAEVSGMRVTHMHCAGRERAA